MNLVSGNARKKSVQKIGLHDGILKKAVKRKEISKNLNTNI